MSEFLSLPMSIAWIFLILAASFSLLHFLFSRNLQRVMLRERIDQPRRK